MEKKEGNVLFSDTLNTFYLWLYGIGHMVTDHSVREKTHCCHYMGYFFQLAPMDLLYAPSQDRIVHTMAVVTPVIGALAGKRNNSMGPL